MRGSITRSRECLTRLRHDLDAAFNDPPFPPIGLERVKVDPIGLGKDTFDRLDQIDKTREDHASEHLDRRRLYAAAEFGMDAGTSYNIGFKAEDAGRGVLDLE